jgi:hypothetical protein
MFEALIAATERCEVAAAFADFGATGDRTIS